ncbi:hypothetical protein ACTXT7_003962 [Hymenolepis weldensis]
MNPAKDYAMEAKKLKVDEPERRRGIRILDYKTELKERSLAPMSISLPLFINTLAENFLL